MVSETPSATTVLIVDDHAMVRGEIRSILEHAEGYTVVAEAANGRDAIALASRHVPDVALVDVAMPGLNGIEATRKLHAADPTIAVVGLSMHSDARCVTGMIDAGACGYLLKTCDAEELLRAVAAVRRGQIYIAADLMHVLVNQRRRAGRDPSRGGAPPPDVLTPRECEVLQLIAEGLTSKEIGANLGAALKTVESHRTNIMRKLNLHSIAALTRYAIREGMTPLID